MSVEKSDDLKYTFSTSVTLYSGFTDHKTQSKTAQVDFTRGTFAYPLMSDSLCAMFMYVMLIFYFYFE
jgi:hypothetical protein